MPPVRRSARVSALALLALALLLVLAGCGGSSSDNGVAAKSPDQILEATKAAARQAASVHIAGSINSGGKPISLNMELLAGKGGKGTISQEGFTINIVQSGGAVYINGSAAFYRHVSGPAAAELLQGKWLKAPEGSGELASLASLTDLSKLIDAALADHGTLTKGSTTTIEGQKAITLNDVSRGGALYVATTGKPYPLQITKGGDEPGRVVFDRWDQPVTITPPANAIDISKLQSGG
ncbi:MAG: hypothetical protein ACLQBB_03655 [Solirubrobacteraceae bacterium]